jgi:UDP-N-acetylglucosamine diphosphorylase/glucosamine-1-phosphate N-acetyltransferase
MSTLYLLEPDNPGAAWAPFAIAGPISDLRAGASRIHQRWSKALGVPAVGIVAAHAKGPRPKGAMPLIEAAAIGGPAWVADATFCPKLPLRALGNARRLLYRGRTVAWRLDAGEKWTGPHDAGDGVVIEGIQMQGSFDLITVLEEFLFTDALAGLEGGSDPVPEGVIVIGNQAALAIRGATVEPGVVFDLRKGAVILERGAEVRSGTRLEGPCWIGEGTRISGGQLRHVSAGPQCRLHGEISTSVFTGYANKSHDGFIGHSVIGEWTNLGAGTITSNLKNTYGPVRLDVAGERIDSGRMQLGSMVGDHAKIAIGTLLPTGTVIGTGASLSGNPRAPKYLPPFAWGDAGDKLDVNRFVAVAERVLPRRDVAVDPSMVAFLKALHQRLTAS